MSQKGVHVDIKDESKTSSRGIKDESKNEFTWNQG